MTTETKVNILIVDQDPRSRRLLCRVLGDEFRLKLTERGSDALAAMAVDAPKLVLLDPALDDLAGLEVIRRIREWSQVWIVVMSAHESQRDKLAAFNAGADDYLAKPFDSAELIARLKVALRRSLHPSDEPLFECEDLLVNLPGRVVLRKGEVVSLTPTEYEILRILVVHAGKVVTQGQLLKMVWGGNQSEHPHILRVNISNLRYKLEEDPANPRHILTEYGVGYRLKLASK